MSKVIDTGFVEIKPRIASNFASDAARQTAPALQKLRAETQAQANVTDISSRRIAAAQANVRVSTLKAAEAARQLNAVRKTEGASELQVAQASQKYAAAKLRETQATERLTAAQTRGTAAVKREATELRGAVTRSVGGTRLTAFGANLTQLAAIGAGYKALTVLRQSVDQASALNETVSKTQVVFGTASAGVLKFGQNAAESLGQSTQQADEAAATFGNLFVSMKLGQEQSAQMSTRLVKLAADLASFNNTDPADALEALRSGLVGEVEPLRRYGVNLSDALLRQKAFDLGLVTTTKQVLPPAAKAQAAYALIFEQSKTAQGDFARTSSGLANQQRILTAQWHDAQAALGRGLIPVAKDLVGILNDDVIPAVTTVGKAFNFLGEHDGLRRGIELITVGYAAKAVLAHRAAKAQAAANLEVAGSYEAVAAAATTAGNAQVAAAERGGAAIHREMLALQGTVGRGGRIRGLAGRFGRGAGVAGLAIGGAYASSTGNAGLQVAGSAAQGAAIGTLIEPGLGTAIGAGAGALYGAVQTSGSDASPIIGRILAEQVGDDPAKYRALSPDMRAILDKYSPDVGKRIMAQSAKFNATIDAQNYAATKPYLAAADRRFRLQGRAERLAAAARQASASVSDSDLFAALPAKPTVDIAGLNDRVANARDRVATAQDRLNALRRSGKATTDQLSAAERSLASAQRSAAEAQRALADGQKKANAGTALSVDEVLKRANYNSTTVVQQLRDERKLYDRGISSLALGSFEALNKDAPGTIHRLTKNLTDAQIEQLNTDAARRQRALRQLAGLPDAAAAREAEEKWRRQGIRDAKAYNLGFNLGLGGGPAQQAGFNRGNVQNFYGPVNDVNGVSRHQQNRSRRGALTSSTTQRTR